MTQQKKCERETMLGVVTPAPVTLIKLREHFRCKYNLNESQVEIMVVSSSKSLKQGLDHLAAAFSQEQSEEQLRAIYHGMKGLLLNMGETEWAAYTREIEKKLLLNKKLDHGVIAGIMRNQMVDVLTYCRAMNAGLKKDES
jgi:hypothetical protein